MNVYVYGDSGGMDTLILNPSIKWEWQLQARSILTPEKAPSTQGIEGSVRSRGGLDAVGKRKNLFWCRKSNRSSSVVQPVA